jgi:hypothetical protein
MLIDDHVFVEFSDVRSGELVNVRAVDLADRVSPQLVDISSLPETYRTTRGVVNVVDH